MGAAPRVSIDLSGYRVLVTGSTRGIGFYVASGLASMGAQVAIVGRSREGVEKALQTLPGKGHAGIAADLTRPEDLESLVDRAWSLLGGLDGLVFNIGNNTCEPCMLHEASLEDWAESAARHLVAPGFLASRYTALLLERKARGVIVFLSSASIREPMKYFALADASRAGLVQLAKSITLYYGSNGVRAYTVLLGSFDTPGARRNLEEIARRTGVSFEDIWRREVLEKTPLGRTAEPWELARLVAYLLTPDAEYLAGSTIVFDGSMTKCAC